MPELTVVTAEGAPGARLGQPIDIAAHVKRLRANRGWTLDQASERSGLSRSAISKIERGEMSPTFDAMQKLASGFGLSLVDFLAAGPPTPAAGRRSVTLADEGVRHETPAYGLRLLTAELSNIAFMAAEIVVRARSLEDYADWDRHDDEDFMYVLAGRVVLYTEHFAPVTLGVDDAVYFDARMGHACVSVSAEDARALWVTAPLPAGSS